MNCTVPAVILLNVTRTPLSPGLLSLPFLPVIMGVLGLSAGSVLFRKKSGDIKGLMLMGTMGLNIGLFAFPIIESLFGAEGLAIAAIMDMGNAFTIFGICYLTGAHYSPLKKHSHRGFGYTIRVFVKSVPFMTYLLAIILNLSGFSFSPVITDWLEIAGKANQFLILMVLGLVLDFSWSRSEAADAAVLLSLRYLVSALLSLCVWYFLPLSFIAKKVAVMCLFLPTGFTLVPYSFEFGYNRGTSNAVVNISLITGFFSMWAVMIFL